jgi:hypothetical protein
MTPEQKAASKATRERKAHIERENARSRPADPYVAKRGPQAFLSAYAHVADESAQARIARGIIVHGVIEHHGIERAREILADNLHTRTLVVKVRETDKVARHMRANSSYASTQGKVRAAKDHAHMCASSLQDMRRQYMMAHQTHTTSTGKTRKAARDTMRAIADRMKREFGAKP